MDEINVNMLWFAFNFSSYYFYKQPEIYQSKEVAGCDLLSTLVLTIFTNNKTHTQTLAVVLWFAFNFSSYYFYKQQDVVDIMPAQFNRQLYVAIALSLGITDKSASHTSKSL